MSSPPLTRRLNDGERFDWLRLSRSENVGPRTFQSLLARFGDAGRALEALPDLAKRAGAARGVAVAAPDAIDAELALARKLGVAFIASCEPEYPPMLARIDSAPPLLGVFGQSAALQQPMIAIVGSRNASGAGLAFTDRLARALGQAGYVIVSGLARGIDHRAHVAALASGTVGVFAGGHARPYPPEAAALAPKIAEHGAVITEMPIEWEPRGRDFPRRNRIVSGLSLGVVVVEAARSSGSLITARLAIEQNREVFAVPGSPLDPRAEGTNDLLRSGALLCARAEDVLEIIEPLRQKRDNSSLAEASESQWPRPREIVDGAEPWDSAKQGGPSDYEAILRLLGPSPVAIDDIIRVGGFAPGSARGLLLDLQLAGKVEFEGGDRVMLRTA